MYNLLHAHLQSNHRHTDDLIPPMRPERTDTARGMSVALKTEVYLFFCFPSSLIWFLQLRIHPIRMTLGDGREVLSLIGWCLVLDMCSYQSVLSCDQCWDCNLYIVFNEKTKNILTNFVLEYFPIKKSKRFASLM